MMVKRKSALIALNIVMVIGFVFSSSNVIADQSPDPETRMTDTGAVFTRDRSSAALNEAWRDPSGLIWGDIVKKTDEAIDIMNHTEATNTCALIGARLPRKEEFTRLREYMGARAGTTRGYSPQVLPNLSDYWFWSSSDGPSDTDYVYGFDGGNGRIAYGNRYSVKALRCVVNTDGGM